MDFENAPLIPDFQRLTDAGMDLPDPDAIDDDHLPAKLWEVIHGLARIRVFLMDTDHLSDRELYEVLWRRVLREEHEVVADDHDSAWHVELLQSGRNRHPPVPEVIRRRAVQAAMARRLAGRSDAAPRGSAV